MDDKVIIFKYKGSKGVLLFEVLMDAAPPYNEDTLMSAIPGSIILLSGSEQIPICGSATFRFGELEVPSATELLIYNSQAHTV